MCQTPFLSFTNLFLFYSTPSNRICLWLHLSLFPLSTGLRSMTPPPNRQCGRKKKKKKPEVRKPAKLSFLLIGTPICFQWVEYWGCEKPELWWMCMCQWRESVCRRREWMKWWERNRWWAAGQIWVPALQFLILGFMNPSPWNIYMLPILYPISSSPFGLNYFECTQKIPV